jgi:hypothetical protein
MNRTVITLLGFALAVFVLTAGAGVASAQNSSFGDLFSPEQGEEMGVLAVLRSLTVAIRTILLPLLTLAVFWAGFTMSTARGNEQQYTKGKKILFQALIGAAVVSVAPLLVDIAEQFKEAL